MRPRGARAGACGIFSTTCSTRSATSPAPRAARRGRRRARRRPPLSTDDPTADFEKSRSRGAGRVRAGRRHREDRPGAGHRVQRPAAARLGPRPCDGSGRDDARGPRAGGVRRHPRPLHRRAAEGRLQARDPRRRRRDSRSSGCSPTPAASPDRPRAGSVRARAGRGAARSRARSHGTRSFTGIARARCQPCTRSQPMEVSRSHVDWSSAPSATTSRPRWRPRSTMARTIATSSPWALRSVTKLRSIFTSLTGRLLR